MKNAQKIVVVIFFLLCTIFTLPVAPAQISAKLTTFLYAKVENSGVNLYNSPNAIAENIKFEIPNSYFVLLLSNYNDRFYKAQYLDAVGFVLKDQVLPVNETPQTPYAEATFYVFTTDGTAVMDSPTSTGKALTTIEKYEDVTYYGALEGEEKTLGRGTTWYFGKTKQGVTGYFYAGLCEMNNAISQNNETVTKATNPFGEDDNDYLYSLIDLSPGVKVVLLLLVLLPAIFLLILAFKPNIMNRSQKPTTKSNANVSPPKKKIRNIKKIENYPEDNL